MPYYGQIYNGDVNIPEGFNIGMVNQEPRFTIFKDAFMDINVKDKVVCDLGAGSGLLGLEAINQGAKHVYLIEIESITFSALKQVVDNHVHKDKITILNKDICNLEKNDFNHTVDIFVTETFGSALYNEGIIVYFNHALELFPNAVTIPNKVSSRLHITNSDFTDNLLWPQVGDTSILHGYKHLRNGKRHQLDNLSATRLKEKSITISNSYVLCWEKDFVVTNLFYHVDKPKPDVWFLLDHQIFYTKNLNRHWCCTGWYFQNLEKSTVEIELENLVNPLIKIVVDKKEGV